MERCLYQPTAARAACGEMKGLPIYNSDDVVCPKPRRIGMLNPSVNDQVRPFRWLINQQTEVADSNSGTELLDLILSKGSYGVERSDYDVASSPPFFLGSPPSRSSNPLVQDSQFGKEELTLFRPPVPTSSPSSSARTKVGSCARAKFVHNAAAVRIEGFDCLSRDRRSVSAVA